VRPARATRPALPLCRLLKCVTFDRQPAQRNAPVTWHGLGQAHSDPVATEDHHACVRPIQGACILIGNGNTTRPRDRMGSSPSHGFSPASQRLRTARMPRSAENSLPTMTFRQISTPDNGVGWCPALPIDRRSVSRSVAPVCRILRYQAGYPVVLAPQPCAVISGGAHQMHSASYGERGNAQKEPQRKTQSPMCAGRVIGPASSNANGRGLNELVIQSVTRGHSARFCFKWACAACPWHV